MKNTIAKVIGGAMVATGTVAVGAIVWKKRAREKTLEKERELLTVITEYLNHLETCVSQDELSVKELMELNSQTSSIEERVNSIGLNVTMDLKKKEMVLSYRSFHRLSSDHDTDRFLSLLRFHCWICKIFHPSYCLHDHMVLPDLGEKKRDTEDLFGYLNGHHLCPLCNQLLSHHL